MYDLTRDLYIGKVLQIDKKYRYDFLVLDLYKDEPEAPVFALRTILDGKGQGNILIDLVDYTNIQNLHANGKYHYISSEIIKENECFQINEYTKLKLQANKYSEEYYIVLHNQKYSDSANHLTEDIKIEEKHSILYLLYTRYYNKYENVDFYNLPYIYRLQKEQILENTKYNLAVNKKCKTKETFYEIQQHENHRYNIQLQILKYIDSSNSLPVE